MRRVRGDVERRMGRQQRHAHPRTARLHESASLRTGGWQRFAAHELHPRPGNGFIDGGIRRCVRHPVFRDSRSRGAPPARLHRICPRIMFAQCRERKCCEIRFPVVEGYAFALRKNEIKADIKAMELLFVEPEQTPTAVFVKPAVGYETGNPSALGPGQFEEQNRQEYYRTTHIQAIKFEIARRIVLNLVGGGDFQPDSRSNPKLAAAISAPSIPPSVQAG